MRRTPALQTRAETAARKERSWRGNMGCESTTASPGVKRGRDPEEEVYLDNLHSHKRYLSEIMASSLNGLTVGDSLAENLREYPTNLRESPARSESISYFRDDMSPQYSPMSEDSEDSRYCDTPTNSTSLQPDFTTNPTSPVSPHRNQRLPAGPVAVSMYPLPSCTLSTVVCSHTRQRGSDTDSRFPSSPNDVCHTADLRKAALLRSVQIRTQGEERPFSGSKTLEDDGDYIEDCSSVDVLNESKLDGDQ